MSFTAYSCALISMGRGKCWAYITTDICCITEIFYVYFSCDNQLQDAKKKNRIGCRSFNISNIFFLYERHSNVSAIGWFRLANFTAINL